MIRSKDHPSGEPDYKICNHYLPFATGRGFVTSVDLVAFVVENGEFLQKFKLADAAVGTWLSPLRVNRVHDIRYKKRYYTELATMNGTVQPFSQLRDV